MSKDFLEKQFIKGIIECHSPEDILNWYRNLYYKEDKNFERRIVAEAINEFFVYKLPEILEEAREGRDRKFQKNESAVTYEKKLKKKYLEEAASKFAGHSDYHGDSVLSALICMAEDKEVKSVKPLNVNLIKIQAQQELADIIHEEICNAIKSNHEIERASKDQLGQFSENFTIICNSKNDALNGIGYFIDRLMSRMWKENESKNNKV